MKKILFFLPFLLMVSACDWFTFDNLEGYDATITGAFVDAGTNQPVQFGVTDTYSFTIYEENFVPKKGTFVASAQTWYAKSNGTYTNKLVFAGDYRIQMQNGNYYPITEKFSIAKGSNTKDFTVTPYARVKDVSFSYDSGSQELVAKFKVEHGDASKTNNIDVNFMIAKARFVAQNSNNAKDATASKKGVAAGTEIELRISTKGGNNSEFQYKQPHYLRIGALATGPGVNGNKKYNYSAVYKVSEDFSKFEEVTDWD